MNKKKTHYSNVGKPLIQMMSDVNAKKVDVCLVYLSCLILQFIMFAVLWCTSVRASFTVG